MTSRAASKRAGTQKRATTGRVTPPKPKVADEWKGQILRVVVQWTAIYAQGDGPPEEITSGAFVVPAREWPGIEDRVNGDVARVAEQINEAGSFEAFQAKVQAEQAAQQQAQQAQAPPG